LTALCISVKAQAQMTKVRSATMRLPAQTAKVGDIIDLTVTVVPAKTMHIYSEKSDCPETTGAQRAYMEFKGKGFVTVGKFYGVGDVLKPDENAEMDKITCKTGVFSGDAVFKQKIKVTGTDFSVQCDFSGQMCNDRGCVPINENIALSGNLLVSGGDNNKKDEKPDDKSAENKDTAKTDSSENAIKVSVEDSEKHSYRLNGNKGDCSPLQYKGSLGDKPTSGGNQGMMLVFWLAFTSGLLALLTPCVFPMIPMTVSFFLRSNDKKQSIRDALVFSVSIIAIYVVIGTIVSKLVGPDAANWLSTHWLPNIFFFAIFLVFAASFFGAFELVLPSSWVTAIDKRADKGGFAGPIFMALTIALVSFSCTGPIVGTVLVESAKGGLATPVVAMFGFSLAFALPFGLLIMFPHYLQSLPRSGGWLNSVKVVLGFIEVAFALKFLSTADQTYHWRLLDREVYLALWIVIFSLMAIYLMGKIKFSHDSDLKYISVPRLFLIIASWSFVAYLIPGMWGAPLKALSGYLPPLHTQDFDINRIALEASGKTTNSCAEPLYGDQLHLPHGIQGYYDYEQALTCAKEQKKPLFIDFTGHGCVNCRKMEEKVWSQPDVLKTLKNDYIVVSLYVDDKKIKLPEDQQFTGRYSKRKITMLGEKNTELQACYFNSNSQPMYVLMTGDEVLLQNPGSAETFDYDSKKFKAFLDNGLKEFKRVGDEQR